MKRPLSGLTVWLLQRLRAVFMLGFLVLVLLHFLVDPRTLMLPGAPG